MSNSSESARGYFERLRDEADEELRRAKREREAHARQPHGQRRVYAKPLYARVRREPRQPHKPTARVDDRPTLGVAGSVAATGTLVLFAVVGLLPAAFIAFAEPWLGLAVWVAIIFVGSASARDAGRVADRGAAAAVGILKELFAEFVSKMDAYEAKWGEWTPPTDDGRGGAGSSNGHASGRRAAAPVHRSPYATLGVPEGSSLHVARAAYVRLIQEVHPDRHMMKPTEERERLADQAKVITAAYNVVKERSRSASAA